MLESTSKLSLLVGLAALCACGRAQVAEQNLSRSDASLSFPATLSDEPASNPAAGRVSVLSYNVNYGVAGAAELERIVREADADLVLLQETNQETERALAELARERYREARYHHPVKLLPEGLAVLSKLPIEEDELIPSAVDWFPANRLVLRASWGRFEAVNTHLRPAISDSGSWVVGYFSTGHYRASEMKRVVARLDSELPTFFAGDFNESDDGDAISLLRERGFSPAIATSSPSTTTWRWVGGSVPLELRLDDVVAEDAGFKVVSAEVLRAGMSDHFPVKVVLERRP